MNLIALESFLLRRPPIAMIDRSTSIVKVQSEVVVEENQRRVLY